MVTMPGTPIESYSPEGEAQTAAISAREPAPYKPDMGLKVKPGTNPYEAFTKDTDAAESLAPADVSWKERFVQHIANSRRGGPMGIYDTTDIRDAQQGYVAGQAVGKDVGQSTAYLRKERRAEDVAAYEGMAPAQGPIDYSAAIAGEVVGSIDPTILLSTPVKIGTAGWRMAYPILSRILESSVSNAAMNAAVNATVQAEEFGSGIREEVDWIGLGLDAAIGAGFGLPAGAIEGSVASRLYAEEAQRAPSAAPAEAPQPAAPRETPPIEGMATPTPEQMQAEFTPAELSQAQVDLFGEVIGTRNLTPEQIAQVDNHLNGGRAADIPQAPPETQGGLTNDTPPPVPAVPDAAPTDNQPVPQVPVGGQQEGPATVPAPLPFDRTERQFAPSELKVDAKRFQFKEGGDEAGVTDRLKGVKKWDPIKSGVTLVWEDLKGDFYIADGHQRHGLASRLEQDGQEPKIRAVVLREADGITAEEARAIAAAKNIAEGTGNAIDAAKILRSRPEMGVDLPPASALVRDAQGLAALSDDAFGMVVNKKVPAGYAAQVGRLAPDSKTHAQLLDLLAKEQPDNAIEAESMIRDALDAPAVQSTMEDMFGSAEVTQILFKERAQVLSAAATAIRKDRAAFTTLVKEEARLTGAGNKLATQSNAERASQDAEILATLQAQARRKGPVADALAAAAKRIKDGDGRQTVVRDFLNDLRRSGEAASPDGGLPGPAGRADQGIAARIDSAPAAGSPAFRKWFGSSKVVDANGKPLVVYHGTARGGFDSFDTYASNYGLMGQGGYFTEDANIAAKYTEKGAAKMRRQGDEPAATVYPVFLSIEKPLDMEAPADLAAWAAAYPDHVTPDSFDPSYVTREGFDGTFSNEDAYRIVEDALRDEELPMYEGAEIMQNGIRAMGHDGITHIGGGRVDNEGPRHRVWIAFDPEQIKSQFNRGTWDATESNIAFSRRPAGQTPLLNWESPERQAATERVRQEMARIAALPEAQKVEAAKQFNKDLSAGLFDTGADAKPQAVIPGAERISDKSLAERRAAAPLKATRPQKNMDVGLFGSEADQKGFAFSAPMHPVEVRAEMFRHFVASQPERTVDELYDGGILQSHQDDLAETGREIADALGIDFKDPGIKKKATAEEKIGRKGYVSTSQLTDLVRAGFRSETPDQAEQIVAMLAQRYSILDEGWGVTPAGYFDRKVMVRFPDGTIGEVQIWHPDLIEAKMNGGGHDLYTAARGLPEGDPEKIRLEKAMEDLYRSILDGLPEDWTAAVGRGGSSPKVDANARASSSAPDSNRPESMTSVESTAVQGLPGTNTAQARPGSTTAGRPSQSTNFTETSSQGTSVPGARGAQGDSSSQGIAFAARPQQGTMPVNRPQAGTAVQPGAAAAPPVAPRLEDIGAELRALTGAPVRQGRLARAPAGTGKVAGQYDRGQGVIRMREMADFETQAHETAHSLETEWGRSLNTIKLASKAELEPLAYSGADPKQQLSEGFAEWFRYYATTPNYARNQAPGFTAAFEDMLRTRDPAQLAAIQKIQADYRAHVEAPSRAVVAGDVVSTRRGTAVTEAIKEAQDNGIHATMATYASTAYTTLVDKLNPINKAVDELAKVYEKRTGRALDITSAQDPYRLARNLQDSYSAGHMDMVNGVTPYHGVPPEGPSLSDALALALGDKWTGWDDRQMADFASYLISRRSVWEYDRFLAGELPNPPGKFTKGDYETTIVELEAEHPEWVQAAEMVYAWQKNFLRKKKDAGFITQGLYDELIQRPAYVPFMRDMTDLDKEAGAEANATLRNSIVKAFKGSKRSVINPIESMMADAYHTNALIRRNDVFKALEDLGRMAGPGGGAIVERIPSSELKGTAVDVNEVLKIAGKEAGLNPGDIDSLTSLVDDLLGEDARATVFRAGDINEKGEPIIYVWRNGKKQALRLADGDFGRELFDSMTGMNKESRDLFVSVLALPSSALRYSITTAPPFVLANYIRDQLSAWVLSGETFIPFITGARGLRDEIMQREITQIYNSYGGIMGGANVAALDKGRAKRDISALQRKGYSVKRFASIHGFAQFTELTETGTRLGVFGNAYKRAKNEGLSDYEAAVEAAYQARDYIDFGRHGSKTHAARRLVTFLNASIQGLDKTFRVLTGEGAIRKAITPYINHRAGRPLSARDKANLGKSAKAWAKLSAIGVLGLGLSYLYKDDPEYEEISDYLRATHWMVKKGPGDWIAIPKPFELGFVSNLFERGFEAVYKRNPVAMESFWSGLFEVTAPPSVVPVFDVGYQLAHNVDGYGRPIVGQDIAGYEPWRQYTAQTSEISKAMGYATNTSPAMIDHAIQGFGASWGKIITDISRDTAQERGPIDSMTGALTRRFIKDVAQGSVSSRAFWDQMSETSGPMAQTANTYKDIFENQGPGAANAFLDGKDDNLKAYAMLNAHFEAKVERLHPMRRAKDAISAISALRKEIAGNNVKPVDIDPEDGEKITMTPDQRQGVQELLARLAMVEARNALITTGIPGFAQKQYMDTETLKQDITTLAPQLGEELTARYEKKKIYDEAYVREVWPDVKKRVLDEGADATFADLISGAQ